MIEVDVEVDEVPPRRLPSRRVVTVAAAVVACAAVAAGVTAGGSDEPSAIRPSESRRRRHRSAYDDDVRAAGDSTADDRGRRPDAARCGRGGGHRAVDVGAPGARPACAAAAPPSTAHGRLRRRPRSSPGRSLRAADGDTARASSVPVEDDGVGSSGDRRRVRRRHVGGSARRVLPRPHRPGHRPRLPARVSARRRPPPLAVPGHVHRPHGQRHAARPGRVRPQHGAAPGRALLHAAPPGHATAPLSFETGTGESLLSRWFWPLGGETIDGRLHVVWVEMVKTSDPRPPDGLGWVPAQTWLATYEASTLTRLAFRPAPDAGVEPVYGFAVSSDDAHTYLFGNTFDQNLERQGGYWACPCSATEMYVARVPRGRLDAAPEYHTAAGWSSDAARAVPIVDRFHAENPMQPRYLGGRWVAVDEGRRVLGRRVGDRRRRRPGGAVDDGDAPAPGATRRRPVDEHVPRAPAAVAAGRIARRQRLAERTRHAARRLAAPRPLPPAVPHRSVARRPATHARRRPPRRRRPRRRRPRPPTTTSTRRRPRSTTSSTSTTSTTSTTAPNQAGRPRRAPRDDRVRSSDLEPVVESTDGRPPRRDARHRPHRRLLHEHPARPALARPGRGRLLPLGRARRRRSASDGACRTRRRASTRPSSIPMSTRWSSVCRTTCTPRRSPPRRRPGSRCCARSRWRARRRRRRRSSTSSSRPVCSPATWRISSTHRRR